MTTRKKNFMTSKAAEKAWHEWASGDQAGPRDIQYAAFMAAWDARKAEVQRAKQSYREAFTRANTLEGQVDALSKQLVAVNAAFDLLLRTSGSQGRQNERLKAMLEGYAVTAKERGAKALEEAAEDAVFRGISGLHTADSPAARESIVQAWLRERAAQVRKNS